MRGIIHIFEIVIVALILFIVLFQFSYIPRMEADWTKTEAFHQGWDILFTLDEKGINWMDKTEVETSISSMLNDSNIQFGITIMGAPKSEIRIGCICSSTETARLEGIVSRAFSINGEDISFTVGRINETDIGFPHRYDVILVLDYPIGSHRPEILNYLEAGKGLVEMRDLASGDVDSTHTDIFGIVWNDSLVTGSQGISFSTDTEKRESYTLYKYFHHVPNGSGYTYEEPHSFSNFLGSEKIWQRDDDARRMPLVQDSTGRPACIINYGVSGGYGRTAWISDMGALNTLGGDEEVLLKSLLMWAAGNDYVVVPSDMARSIMKLSFLKVLNTDMYQPVEIVMEMGYLY